MNASFIADPFSAVFNSVLMMLEIYLLLITEFTGWACRQWGGLSTWVQGCDLELSRWQSDNMNKRKGRGG